jgi:hypothetical protein
MDMQDSQEKEAYRRMIKMKSSKTGLSEMVGITSISEGEDNQVNWRVDLVAKIELTPGGRNTFLAKREC